MILKASHLLRDFCDDNGYSFSPIYTDTDSLIFEIKTKKKSSYQELYDQMYEHPELNSILDFNSLGEDKFKDSIRDKAFGLMSSECTYRDNITKIFCISAKCYAYETESGAVTLKGKGCSNTLLKENISIKDYERCVYDYSFKPTVKYSEFVKANMVIKTNDTKKVALCNSDLKSFAKRNPNRSIDLINIGY